MRASKAIQTALAILAVTFLSGSPPIAQQHKHEAPQDAPSLKLNTELVSLSVTVTDRSGKAVSGLKQEDFKVYENGVEQRIEFYSAETAPVSWGLVLDRSTSMEEMIRDVYRAAVHVVDEGTEQDEAFIVTFSGKPELVSDFVSDKHRLQNSILGLRADGTTALWDAIGFGLDRLKQAKHRKKVLVAITDGEDNSSRINFRNLIERVEEEEALIYTVGMFESSGLFRRGILDSYLSRNPREELAKLAEVTGASAHFPTSVEECRKTMRAIASEVNHQYSVGYYPSDTKNDGKWRKLQVVAGQGEGETGYVARTRGGYYAPKGDEAK